MSDLAVYNFNADICTYEDNLIFSDSVNVRNNI